MTISTGKQKQNILGTYYDEDNGNEDEQVMLEI